MATTRHQSISSDIFTPANAVTLLGALLTIAGALRLDTAGGLITVIVGRFFDVLDGPIARRTHTSHFGAGLDATSDKIVGFIMLIAAYHFKSAPLLFLCYFLVYHLGISIINALTEVQGTPTHALNSGKRTMLFHVSALLLFIWASLIAGLVHTWLYGAAVIIAIISIWFATQSFKDYFKQYRQATVKAHK